MAGEHPLLARTVEAPPPARRRSAQPTRQRVCPATPRLAASDRRRRALAPRRRAFVADPQQRARRQPLHLQSNPHGAVPSASVPPPGSPALKELRPRQHEAVGVVPTHDAPWHRLARARHRNHAPSQQPRVAGLPAAPTRSPRRPRRLETCHGCTSTRVHHGGVAPSPLLQRDSTAA